MISPAIHFPGNCGEAIEFYKEVFNATVIEINYNSDAPSDSGFTVTDDTKNFIMHAVINICGTNINMCDTPDDEIIIGNMILFNAFFDSAEEVCNVFDKIKNGGKIFVECGPQFFSPMYGSVEDRYGIHWQLITNQ